MGHHRRDHGRDEAGGGGAERRQLAGGWIHDGDIHALQLHGQFDFPTTLASDSRPFSFGLTRSAVYVVGHPQGP